MCLKKREVKMRVADVASNIWAALGLTTADTWPGAGAAARGLCSTGTGPSPAASA